MQDIHNKVALITGGTKGIGYGVADGISEWRVVFLNKKKHPFNATNGKFGKTK